MQAGSMTALPATAQQVLRAAGQDARGLAALEGRDVMSIPAFIYFNMPVNRNLAYSKYVSMRKTPGRENAVDGSMMTDMTVIIYAPAGHCRCQGPG